MIQSRRRIIRFLRVLTAVPFPKKRSNKSAVLPRSCPTFSRTKIDLRSNKHRYSRHITVSTFPSHWLLSHQMSSEIRQKELRERLTALHDTMQRQAAQQKQNAATEEGDWTSLANVSQSLARDCCGQLAALHDDVTAQAKQLGYIRPCRHRSDPPDRPHHRFRTRQASQRFQSLRCHERIACVQYTDALHTRHSQS